MEEPFTLETRTDAEIAADKKREQQRAKIREGLNRRLTGDAGELGTADMIDRTAGQTPLFSV